MSETNRTSVMIHCELTLTEWKAMQDALGHVLAELHDGAGLLPGWGPFGLDDDDSLDMATAEVALDEVLMKLGQP